MSLGIPNHNITNYSLGFNSKKSKINNLNSSKMRGGGLFGKKVKIGGFKKRKKGGVTGNIWKYTNKSTIWGATRKNEFKNLSNENLTTVSKLIYNEMKKNSGTGLTKYQKQKIIRQARNLVSNHKKNFSREDLKDLKKIVHKIDNHFDDINHFKNRKNQSVTPKIKKTISKITNTTHTVKISTPTVLKKNNHKKTTGKDEYLEKNIKNDLSSSPKINKKIDNDIDNNLLNRETETKTTIPPITMANTANQQQINKNNNEDLPDMQID